MHFSEARIMGDQIDFWAVEVNRLRGNAATCHQFAEACHILARLQAYAMRYACSDEQRAADAAEEAFHAEVAEFERHQYDQL